MGIWTGKLVNLALWYFLQSLELLRRYLQKYNTASLTCPSATGASKRGICIRLGRYPKIFSRGLYVLCRSLPGIAASVIVLTTLLVIPMYSLQLLVYICFAVAIMHHLLKVPTFYHIQFHKVIS